MSSNAQLPKLPPLRLAAVMRRRKRLSQSLQPFIGCQADRDILQEMTEQLCQHLPAGVVPEVVEESLLHLAGTKPSQADLELKAWQLAGNVERLLSGKPVLPWRRQEASEWTPVQVVDARLRRTKRGKLGATFTLRALAGNTCGMLLEKFWTQRFCRFVSNRLGFTPPWKKHPFKKLEQLVGLRLCVLVEPPPAKLETADPWFEHLAVPSSLQSFNRKLIKIRDRIGFVCPLKLQHPCTACWVGYDHCAAAVHPRTFVRRVCAKCKQQAWLDPRFEAVGICVSCRQRQDLGQEPTGN